ALPISVALGVDLSENVGLHAQADVFFGENRDASFAPSSAPITARENQTSDSRLFFQQSATNDFIIGKKLPIRFGDDDHFLRAIAADDLKVFQRGTDLSDPVSQSDDELVDGVNGNQARVDLHQTVRGRMIKTQSPMTVHMQAYTSAIVVFICRRNNRPQFESI